VSKSIVDRICEYIDGLGGPVLTNDYDRLKIAQLIAKHDTKQRAIIERLARLFEESPNTSFQRRLAANRIQVLHLVIEDQAKELAEAQATIGRLQPIVDWVRRTMTRTHSDGNKICNLCGRWGSSDGEEPDHMPACLLAAEAAGGKT